MNAKNNNGMSLVSLIITILVMLIIIGTVIYIGLETLKEKKYEDVKTNMLLLQSQIKTYVEQAKLEEKETINEVTVNDIALIITESSVDGFYKISNIEELEVSGVNSSEYLVSFNVEELSVDIYYVPGIMDADENIYYELSEME